MWRWSSGCAALEQLWGDIPQSRSEKAQQDGRCWSGGCTVLEHTPYPRAKEKPQQDGRRGEFMCRIKPQSRWTHWGLKQTLCAPGTRDPTETETELCLSISCGGTGQQWPATRAGALGEADWGMAYALFKEVTINPTIELPEFTQVWGNRLWQGTKRTLCAPGPRRKEQWPHEGLTQTCLGVSRSLQQRHGWVVAHCRFRGIECSTGSFEGGHYYLHYHHSMATGK